MPQSQTLKYKYQLFYHAQTPSNSRPSAKAPVRLRNYHKPGNYDENYDERANTMVKNNPDE